jgi:septum site-determining protein MinC
MGLFEQRGLTLWAVLALDEATREAARALGLATRLSGSSTDLEGNVLQPGGAVPAIEEPDAPNGDRPAYVSNTLLLRETVRSGRSIFHEGHVVVLGDVNAGAEIVAGGHVVVWGRLRGLVHAGALGDPAATICALELTPTQLRIADQIAVDPDQANGRRSARPEQAVIRDGQIVAEPWQPREGGERRRA